MVRRGDMGCEERDEIKCCEVCKHKNTDICDECDADTRSKWEQIVGKTVITDQMIAYASMRKAENGSISKKGLK